MFWWELFGRRYSVGVVRWELSDYPDEHSVKYSSTKNTSLLATKIMFTIPLFSSKLPLLFLINIDITLVSSSYSWVSNVGFQLVNTTHE